MGTINQLRQGDNTMKTITIIAIAVLITVGTYNAAGMFIDSANAAIDTTYTKFSMDTF